MPQFVQKAQPLENRWLLYILTFLTFVATVAPTSLAKAAVCRYIENDGTIPGMATGKGSWSEREMFGGLVLSPVRGVIPYIKNSRIVLSDTENQGIVTIRACLGQDILKSELFTQAMIIPIGKTPANAHRPSKKVSALPYNGNRQVHAVRTKPPEMIGVPPRSKITTTIGPVQEIQKPILPYAGSMNQVIAGGDQTFVEVGPFVGASQLPNNETFRMNRTTAQGMHYGNCSSECL